jgi:hypothetical protein
MPITNELFTSGATASSNTNSTSLFHVAYEDTRSETLILKSDLTSAGLLANDVLKDLRLYISELPDIDLTNVKIGIKHTTKTSNTAGVFEVYSTYTEVFSVAKITKNLTIGWYTFTFLRDFIWNGNDNLLVTLIRSDSTYGGSGRWQTRTLTTPQRYRGKALDGTSSTLDGVSAVNPSVIYVVPSMRITVADRGGSGVPTVTSLVANKTKISDEPNVNQSIITVQFDSDVTQYVARLNGSDYNTGTLVHTGGAVAANTNASIIIDWNELSTEGQNRINIYGQNANGWTAYTA